MQVANTVANRVTNSSQNSAALLRQPGPKSACAVSNLNLLSPHQLTCNSGVVPSVGEILGGERRVIRKELRFAAAIAAQRSGQLGGDAGADNAGQATGDGRESFGAKTLVANV
jgi:hypothetical protein